MIPRLPRLKPPSSIYPPRSFFSTTQHHPQEKTHYEILNLPPDVSPSDLKKQFYVLSKETHPDVSRNDPRAGDRFAQISESYSVLADPDRRKKYDRDVMRHRRPPGGSTGSYAGSRPATGLSRRRSAFKGPPPSYYTHFNQTANDRARAGGSGSGSAGAQGGTFNAAAYADGAGGYDPAFDSESIYKTQTQEDTRRHHRRAAAIAEAQAQAEQEGNFWARFVVVTGVVVFGVSAASVVAGTGSSAKGGLVRGDGSRRGNGNGKIK